MTKLKKKTEKVMIRLKIYTYQKYKWECSHIKAVATWDWNVRKDKRHSLVYVDGWTVQKSLLYEWRLQKPPEIPIFQFAGRFKIQVDSFLTAFTVLEIWMKSMAKKQGYIYHFFFLAKIVTTKIWLSGVLDYSNKNDNWTITPLSHISLMLQYYFFFTSIDYNEEKKQVIQRRK